MRDKNDTDKNPITDLDNIFISDPKIAKIPAGHVDFDEIHLAPLDDLFDDNYENNNKK
ncbi:hypothetical protein HBE96_24510 [Clostridium sp. P21]|uniref:Uncharacterized protein n=1 Tax=Clostridium muellerianum TaxID=2716538 RepID=A0A7Y0HR46_9CLOT|nr:hypothetical protein [Clostridium muellerianum]NMM65745.1 hypothetical protein [Clostridium muellerianum]